MATSSHSDKSFAQVLKAFPRQVALTAQEQQDLRDDLDEILAVSDEDPDFLEFVEKLEKEKREGTQGGRPLDTSTTTKILSLLGVYQRYSAKQQEDWEIGASPNSNFPRFMAAALSLVRGYKDSSAAERLGKKWFDIRKIMYPSRSD